MTPLFDVPNLDDITVDPGELWEVGDALGTLGKYAHCKSMAMKRRLDGDISAALEMERRCECLYKCLPRWARW